MNLRLWRQTLLAALMWPVVCAAVQDAQHREARQWLERMIEATRTLDYEGNFVYLQGEHLEAMHISHSNQADGERQHMVSLNGPRREVVVTNNQVTCVSPKQQIVLSGSRYSRSSFPISVPSDLSKLEDFYSFKMLGNDRVAGHDTQIIAIKPRDELRFGYQLWLDSNTAMVLRSALLNEEGRVVEQMMFTDLQFNPTEPVSAKLVSPVSPDSSSAPEDHPKEERSPWLVEELPVGFKQIMYKRLPDTPGHQPIEHSVFTDGLVTVSVFVEKLTEAGPLLVGPSQMGAMNAYGTTLDDSYQVVAVGEVPPITVQLIASSVRKSGAGQ